MGGDSEKRKKLLDFLNQKAFEPVLRASKQDYSNEADQKLLADVQRRTKSEQERFACYENAEKVKQMFEGDLDSRPAKKVQAELRKLGLPTLPDLEEEFEQICEESGVK